LAGVTTVLEGVEAPVALLAASFGGSPARWMGLTAELAFSGDPFPGVSHLNMVRRESAAARRSSPPPFQSFAVAPAAPSADQKAERPLAHCNSDGW
jgi:hypothetical protein